VAERDDYESRLERLRDATAGIRPPPALCARVLAGARRPAGPSLWEALWSLGRWALLPAACASAALAAVAVTTAGWLDEAVFVASSVGWVP
jgi:hypothetical protein